MYKIIGNDGKEYGPVSAEQIRQWIVVNRCVPQTPAQPEGTKNWLQLSQIPEFADALAKAAANRPPPLPLPGAQPKKSTNPMAIVGIVLAVVFGGIFLIGVLAGIAIPNFVRARQQAQANQCENNMKQLANAVRLYTSSHGDQFPPGATWSDVISNSVSSATSFTCPADQTQTCGYAFNRQLDGKKLSQVNPATILLFESDAGWNGTGGETEVVSRGHPAPARNRNGFTRDKNYHFVLVDGSFVSIPASGLTALRWEP
jgi:type II secretory pathway pseudopilin PulG